MHLYKGRKIDTSGEKIWIRIRVKKFSPEREITPQTRINRAYLYNYLNI